MTPTNPTRVSMQPTPSHDFPPTSAITSAARPREMDRRHFIGSMAALPLSLGMFATFNSLRAADAASFAPTVPDDPPAGLIVVTTPTGNIGRQVLDNILNKAARVRVIARDPEKLSPGVRERVEVVQGSHSDEKTVRQAFAGADAVFWLCPPNPRAASVEAAYVDFTRPAAEALRDGDVKRVVGISALGRGTPLASNAGFVTASLAMDDLLAGTGVGFRALTMPSFMDNIARQAEPIKRRGVFFSPISGDRKMPVCATRDIAAVASGLLLDSAWSGRGSVPVLGPADLSFNDMALIMSEVLGKPVRFEQITFDAYKAGFIQRGMSEAMAQGMVDMARAKHEGLDNAEPRTAANTTPTSFRQWCEEELKPLILA